MNTSYFSKYKEENGISIAGKCPEWYSGREYKKLAPKYWFSKNIKKMGIKNITLNNILKKF